MYMELYVGKERLQKAVIRSYREDDFSELIEIQRECFPPPFPEELLWNHEQLSNHVRLFPDGALCVEIDGRLAGSMTSLIVTHDDLHPHTWASITDEGYIRNHDPQGDTLYVVDISVRPAYRSLGIGKLLMQSMYYVVVHYQLKRLLGGGRMPGYHLYAEKLTPQEYLARVVRGEINDKVISFLLRCGRIPVGIAENYLEDEESRNCAALMEWRNPFYKQK